MKELKPPLWKCHLKISFMCERIVAQVIDGYTLNFRYILGHKCI
jgi:hypothetical protein